MVVKALLLVVLVCFSFSFDACSKLETPRKPTPDEIREKTAQATAALKSNARAVAQGIREGWSRDHPLDLNSASKDQLLALPGINDAVADRIIARRPYAKAADVVRKRAVTQTEYARFADRVTVK